MLCPPRRRQAEALDAALGARAALVDGSDRLAGAPRAQQAILRQDPQLDAGAVRATCRCGRRQALRRREHELPTRARPTLPRGAEASRLVELGSARPAAEEPASGRARGAVIVGRCWRRAARPYWPEFRPPERAADDPRRCEQLSGRAPARSPDPPEVDAPLDDLRAPVPSESESARSAVDAISQFPRWRPRTADRPGSDDRTPPTRRRSSCSSSRAGAGGARVPVIAAYRDVDPAPTETMMSLLAELAREHVVVRLPLHGLDSDAVAEYVERTAAELASPALTEALTDDRGKPSLRRRDRPAPGARGPERVPSGGHSRSPEHPDVIARRIALLPDACSRTCAAAVPDVSFLSTRSRA